MKKRSVQGPAKSSSARAANRRVCGVFLSRSLRRLLFLFADAFFLLLLAAGAAGGHDGGGGGGAAAKACNASCKVLSTETPMLVLLLELVALRLEGVVGIEAWKACKVSSMETPRLVPVRLALVALRVEDSLGRRGQIRRLKVVCERRKTRESTSRRAGSERERMSKGNGFRAAGIVVVGDAGVTILFSALWLLHLGCYCHVHSARTCFVYVRSHSIDLVLAL
jgi:hypothetical protein